MGKRSRSTVCRDSRSTAGDADLEKVAELEDIDSDGHFDDVNEDADGNGIINCEDKNGNGMLDPVQGCTIASPIGTENGVASTTMIYPMSFAYNITVRITAEAGGISGFYDYLLLCTTKMVEQGTCGLGY